MCGVVGYDGGMIGGGGMGHIRMLGRCCVMDHCILHHLLSSIIGGLVRNASGGSGVIGVGETFC